MTLGTQVHRLSNNTDDVQLNESSHPSDAHACVYLMRTIVSEVQTDVLKSTEVESVEDSLSVWLNVHRQEKNWTGIRDQ